MTIRERAILLKINEAIIKLGQAPQTTFSPLTGQIPQQPLIQPPVYPLPIITNPQPPRNNTPTG